jgi:hypothetical protein
MYSPVNKRVMTEMRDKSHSKDRLVSEADPKGGKVSHAPLNFVHPFMPNDYLVLSVEKIKVLDSIKYCYKPLNLIASG